MSRSPSDTPLDWPLLLRFLAGECTPAEAAALKAWMDASPENRTQVEELRSIVQAANLPDHEFDQSAAWNTVATRHGLEGRLTPSAAEVRKSWRSRWRSSFRAHAAGRPTLFGTVMPAILAALVIGIVFHGYAGRFRAGHEYVTSQGQRLQVELPDGTELVIAPASRVQIAVDYGRPTREITVDGEAFVRVKHDVRHPFVVHTRDALTRDIGTEFDVRSYQTDQGSRVAVAEGAVDFELRECVAAAKHEPCRTELRPGDAATVSPEGLDVRHDVRLAALTAWVQGDLVFEDTPLREVARAIGRHYDLDITVADSALAAKLVTETFTNQPLSVVLDDIMAVVGAQYQRSGKTIVVRPRSTRLQPSAPPRHAAVRVVTLAMVPR